MHKKPPNGLWAHSSGPSSTQSYLGTFTGLQPSLPMLIKNLNYSLLVSKVPDSNIPIGTAPSQFPPEKCWLLKFGFQDRLEAPVLQVPKITHFI